MHKYRINLDKMFAIYSAILILFTSYNVFYKLPLSPIFNLLMIILIFITNKSIEKIDFTFFVLFLIVFIRASIPHNFNVPITTLISLLVNGLLISSLFLIKRDILINIYKIFKIILTFILSVGFIFFILKFIGFDINPLTTYITTTGRYYNVYPLLVGEFVIDGIRFASIFDEPGFLGTILAFILVIEEFRLFRLQNLVFFISGIFTFSIAFYIICAIGLGYMFRKKLKTFLPIFILIIIIGFFLYNKFQPHFEIFIVNRMMIDDSYTLIGDNRGGVKENIDMFNDIYKSSNFLFGRGISEAEDLNKINYRIGSSSWGRILVENGLVFFIYLLALFYFYTKYKNKNYIFLFLFILSLYQRPQIFNSLFIMLFIFANNNMEKNNIKQLS